MVCVYTFKNGDVVRGKPALKAYLTANLASLLPERAAQAGFKRSPVAAAVSTQSARPKDASWMLEVDDIVDKVTKNLGSKPNVINVWDLSDDLIPQDVKDHEQRARAEGKELGDIRGFYWIPTGQTFMVSSAIESEYDATVVLKHELDHFGLHQFFGQSITSELEQIIALRRKDVIERAKSEGLYGEGIDIKTATNAEIFASMTQEDKLHAAEEVIVYMAETQPNLGFVKRIVAAIQTWLRKNVPGFASMKLSDAEIIRDFILPARELVETGVRNSRMANDGQKAIRFNRAPAKSSPAPAGLTPPEQGLLRRLQANFQDNNNRIKEIQKRIEEATGVPVPDHANYYQAEDNRPGRIAARLADFRERMQAPLIEAIAKSGHTLEQVEELSHAMHAQERNEVGGKLHPEDSDFYKAMDDHAIVGTSGMATGKANEIIAKYSGDKAIQKYVKQLQQIARAALDTKLASGLIDQEKYDAFVAAYDNYVPLKGDGEYGPKVKRAMGHEERDEHIIENVMRDYEQAVVASERNLARKSFLQLVLTNPDNELWSVGVAPKGRYIAGQSFEIFKGSEKVASFDNENQAKAWVEGRTDGGSIYTIEIERGKFTVEKDGRPIAYVNSHSAAEKYISNIKDEVGKFEITNTGERVREFVKPLQDNEVPVYVDGQMVRIQIKNETLAQQLRPMNQEQMGVILGAFRSLLRWMSHAYTGYNPNFLITNTVRDMQEGTENMVGNYGPAMSAKAWSNYKSAAGALWHFARNGREPNTEAGQMLKEYRMNGGKTGASYMSDLEQQGKTVQRLYDDAYGAGGYLKKGMTGKAAVISGRKIIGGMAGFIEKMNQVTENSLRLALYMAMRQSGESAGKAAMAAKNVTVNFDRKGSQTSVMSALYLFFNPAVQGTANIIRTLVKGKYRKYAWGGLATIGALGAFAAGQGLDDDEDRWLGEGWETRTKKLVLNFGGKRVTVPLAQGLVPFYAIGVALEEVRRGKASPTAGAGRVLSSFIDAYVPFNGLFNYDSNDKALDAALAMTPTAVRSTLVEPAVNRNSFGSKIVPENEFTKDRPDNLKMNRNTKGTVYDSAAQGIAKVGELAGAGRYENDITKVSPEMLKHHFRNFTGGLGTFIGDAASLARIAAEDPSAVELADVPVVKAFAKGQDVSPLRGRFYDLTKDARAVSEEFKQAKKAGDDAAMDDIESRPEKAELLGLDRLIKSTTKAAAGIRDEMVDINQDKSLSLAEKRAQLKALEKEEEELYRDAIKAFKP